MADYAITQVYPSDKRSMREVEALLNHEGIRLDRNLDYTCALVDDAGDIVATGSLFKNTLRCMAVSSDHRGEGLMNTVVSHLVETQYLRGNSHLFLYTKCDSAKFFGDLGFYEIARIDGELVFMENERRGFEQYLEGLKKAAADSSGVVSAIVMNANPFTKGHRYLVETASRENDRVLVFAVSEDASLIPWKVRKRLIIDGTEDLANVTVLESGPYIISSATFPSYFQKDEESVIRGHALLDITIFGRIARELGITRRYVGEEKRSLVTGIYNEIMKEKLPEAGVEVREIPRLTTEAASNTASAAAAASSAMASATEADAKPVSASNVRVALQQGDFETLKKLLPETSLRYFQSDEAKPVIDAICRAGDVVHY